MALHFTGGPPTGRPACVRLLVLPLWTPHAVCLCEIVRLILEFTKSKVALTLPRLPVFLSSNEATGWLCLTDGSTSLPCTITEESRAHQCRQLCAPGSAGRSVSIECPRAHSWLKDAFLVISDYEVVLDVVEAQGEQCRGKADAAKFFLKIHFKLKDACFYCAPRHYGLRWGNFETQSRCSYTETSL
jgi:hypothetical protein